MDAAFGPELYYKHSGKFFAGGVLIALFIGLLVGLPCAWLYALLIHWNPFIYIDALASFGFRAIIRVAPESSLESHKCRNVPIARLPPLLVLLLPHSLNLTASPHPPPA